MSKESSSGSSGIPIDRRAMLKTSAAAAAAVGAASFSQGASAEKVATKGRINQSVVHWCFESYWNVEETCRISKQLGCVGLELIDPEHWPTLKKYDQVCALAPSHWFDEGMNNPKYQEMCIGKMRKAIDDCAEFGFKDVITFTGFREDIDDDQGLKNCVNAYKKIVGHAEKKGITLCLEMLNSRVTEEMKGHPGYQGDHTDYVMEIIKGVGSPRLTLLFDVYHVQIMDGDVISRIRQYKDYIGHYHVAGNPGRAELDDTQEINYKPIIEEIAKTGYKGYLGQEFLPTRDPLEGLIEAVRLCDV